MKKIKVTNHSSFVSALETLAILFSFNLLIQFYFGTLAYIITYLPTLLLSVFLVVFGLLILETITLFKKDFLLKCNQNLCTTISNKQEQCADKKNALIYLSSSDHNHSFHGLTGMIQSMKVYLKLSKYYNVKAIISNNLNALEQESNIDLLMLSGHGNPCGIQIGQHTYGSGYISDITKKCLKPMFLITIMRIVLI